MTDSVEAYLDRLFDLLAGAGARGRRALGEAQAHLDEAVENAMAAGMAREDAQRLAIAQFGRPEEIARRYLALCALPFACAFGRLFAAGWLLAGAAATAIGVSGALAMMFARAFGPAFVAPDDPDILLSDARCQQLGVFAHDQVVCRAASIAHHVEALTDRPVAIGVVGLILLGLFWCARRVPLLRAATTLPSAAMVAAAGTVAFSAVGVVILMYGLLALAVGHVQGAGAHLAQGLAAVAAACVFLPRAWRQLRLQQS